MDNALLEAISEAVHRGWMEEKQRQGFADHAWFRETIPCEWCGPVAGETCCGLPKDKHHADMLPYAELAENVKEYDRATVRAVIGAAEAAGYHFVAVAKEKTAC